MLMARADPVGQVIGGIQGCSGALKKLHPAEAVVDKPTTNRAAAIASFVFIFLFFFQNTVGNSMIIGLCPP